MKEKISLLRNLMWSCLTLSGCLFSLTVVNVPGYNRLKSIITAIILLVPALIFYRRINVLIEQKNGIFVYNRKTASKIFDKFDQFVKNSSTVDFIVDIISYDDEKTRVKIAGIRNSENIHYNLNENWTLAIDKEYSEKINIGDVFDFSEDGRVIVILKDYSRLCCGFLVLKRSD